MNRGLHCGAPGRNVHEGCECHRGRSSGAVGHRADAGWYAQALARVHAVRAPLVCHHGVLGERERVHACGWEGIAVSRRRGCARCARGGTFEVWMRAGIGVRVVGIGTGGDAEAVDSEHLRLVVRERDVARGVILGRLLL